MGGAAIGQETNNPAIGSAPAVSASDVKQATDAGATEVDASQEGDELGSQSILRSRRRPRMFRAYSDTQYLYDSNVLLADGDFILRGSDAVFIQDFGALFSPALIEPLASSLYYHHNLVRYDDFSQFDFDADTGGLHLGLPVKDLFTIYGDFSASRYYFREHGSEFYKYFDGELGLGREQRLGRRTSLLYGYQLDWRPSSPSDLTRIDNAGYVGVSLGLMDKLTSHFLYRIRVREYYQASHTDLDHLLNLTLAYSFNDSITARLFVTYGINNSTVSIRDYTVFNGGGGLNLSIRF
jgi:hypothetical protein